MCSETDEILFSTPSMSNYRYHLTTRDNTKLRLLYFGRKGTFELGATGAIGSANLSSTPDVSVYDSPYDYKEQLLTGGFTHVEYSCRHLVCEHRRV